MKRYFLLLMLLAWLAHMASAQYYAGKFKSKPSLDEYAHFIVMHDQNEEGDEIVSSVKAYDDMGEQWHIAAVSAEEEICNAIKENFGEDNIETIYKLDHIRHGEQIHYYLVGYMERGQKTFVLVEEWYHGPEDVQPIELETLVWASAGQ